MEIDFQQIRFFTALMAEGSACRASLELRTSRSNVRRVWQLMEEELGEKLFEVRDRGELKPTTTALHFEREMSSLLDEIRGFEAAVRKIHQTGRVLRLGADRSIFNTRHFGHLFNSVRDNPQFRVSFVEVKVDEGRAALESGSCDLVFSVDGVAGRRLETRELPPISLAVACLKEPPETEAIQPCQLSERSWSLATFAGPKRSLETLRQIQDHGAGEGRLCSQNQFIDWAEDSRSPGTDAVVCVRPVSFRRLPQVNFVRLDSEVGFPLNVSYLKQHPYEFLPSTVDQMHRALNPPARGI
ncbi:LysR family transcriptional regulator [Luteolibacter marinus]|uniref:LysR family transcriptional regulator n=1 Tax=Luteolibacter marinus TaxID=2776705 RepID=UPI0018682D72|nr:LysR family transcriptional regulator [Luteolibacter marinus]